MRLRQNPHQAFGPEQSIPWKCFRLPWERRSLCTWVVDIFKCRTDVWDSWRVCMYDRLRRVTTLSASVSWTPVCCFSCPRLRSPTPRTRRRRSRRPGWESKPCCSWSRSQRRREPRGVVRRRHARATKASREETSRDGGAEKHCCTVLIDVLCLARTRWCASLRPVISLREKCTGQDVPRDRSTVRRSGRRRQAGDQGLDSLCGVEPRFFG